jgi:riboflavin kinase/FMN adenylyltransferase
VVTIGVFDGVHRGHQQILGRAVERARAAAIPSVVLTFDPHPAEVVRPGSHPTVLTGPRRKAELFEQLGIDVMCVLPFNQEFSRLAPDEFVHRVLVEHLHAAAVVVGENFRFGHKAAGDVTLLRSLGSRFGFATEAVGIVRDDDMTYSSTYIRSCVDAGDVDAAARALTRPHRLEGVVVRGDMRGRALGYPTANLETAPHAAIPADGVAAVPSSPPSRSAATPPSRARSGASRRTRWTSTPTCTARTSPSSSSRGCGGWCASTPSRSCAAKWQPTWSGPGLW